MADFPILLAIDTSTPVCSAALQSADGAIHERTEIGQGVHSARLPAMVAELLELNGIRAADVDRILISRGPGSFTGLRIGVSFVKGLGFGRMEWPVHTADSLRMIAEGTLRHSVGTSHSDGMWQPGMIVHAAIDARRDHLYHWAGQVDAAGRLTTLMESRIRTLQEIASRLEDDVRALAAGPAAATAESAATNPSLRIRLAGTGWDRLPDPFSRLEGSGLDAIRASTLIHAFNSPESSMLFRLERLQDLTPEYGQDGPPA